MNAKVLVVDDEQNVLDGISRRLRKKIRIETALSAAEGLVQMEHNGPYAVIISDLRMPVMDGIQFLSRVKECSPDTVRMILTGNADVENAIQAVNEGNIFRFFTKPCPIETLTKGIQAGIKQYRLVRAERELLQSTLKGSIKVLTEVLSIVNPEAFGRSSRIERLVIQIASQLGVPESWQFELAAMLSQVGCVTLPEMVLNKIYESKDLTEDESQLFEKHPLIASDLLSHIPRLEKVAETIKYQEKHFDGSGIPKDSRRGEDIPLGSRILKVVLDFDILEKKEGSTISALRALRKRNGRYDPAILQVMDSILKAKATYNEKIVQLKGLETGMILDEDIFTKGGRLLISRGQEITPMLIDRLMNFARNSGIKEPIRILIPC